MSIWPSEVENPKRLTVAGVFAVIPAKAGIQSLDPGSESGVTNKGAVGAPLVGAQERASTRPAPTALVPWVPRTCRPVRPCTDELRTSVAP